MLVLGRIPLPLPAFIPLVIWFGFQLVMVVADTDDEVSWAAHIGGIVTGAALVPLMKRRAVPLFDRKIVSPKAVVHKKQAQAPGRGWGR